MRPDHRKSEALQRRSAHLWHGATGPPVAVSRSRCAANPLPPLPCWRSEFSALVGLRPDFQTEAAKAAAVLRAPAAVKRAEPVVRPEAALPEAAARQVKAEARPYAAVAPAPAARSACAPAAAEERRCASQSRTADNVHPAGPSQCASAPPAEWGACRLRARRPRRSARRCRHRAPALRAARAFRRTFAVKTEASAV